MTAEIFNRELTGLVQRKPFTFFTVELKEGERFEVDGPRAIVFRDGVAVFLARGGTSFWFDHDSVNQFIVAPE